MNSIPMIRRVFAWRMQRCACSLLIALSSMPGCESKIAEVSGTVTYQGQALTSGNVTFIGSDGIGYMAPIDSVGKYSTKVAIGDAKVMVVSIDESKMQAAVEPKDKAIRGGNRNGEKPPSSPTEAKDFSLIPRKYGDQRTSQITFKVNPGKNAFDIRLE